MKDPDRGDPADEALVASAREGDVAAMDVLLRRHERRVLRVLRLLGVSAHDREDVAQEVFVRAFRHIAGFRTGHPFAGWIYRIAVNAAHDHRRRAARRRREETGWEPAFDQLPDRGPSPSAGLDRLDSRRRLESALAALSERERAVFVLCEMERLATREVARALGITSITVRRHLGRARAHLQELLGGAEKKSSPALNDGGADEVVS